MNKLITSFSLLGIWLLLILSGCDKNEDITPPGVVYVSNQIPLVNEYHFSNRFRFSDHSSRLSGDTVYTFPAKITMPATEKITVTFDVDEDYVEAYNKVNNQNYASFPKNFYTIEKGEVTIEQGEMASRDSVVVKLNTKADWNNLKGDRFLFPVRIASVSGKTTTISSTLHVVKIFGSLLKVVDNIDSSNEPIEGVVFNDGVTLDSNYDQSSLPSLIDGNISGWPWYTSSASHYIDVILDHEQLLKGVKLNTSSFYQLGSVTVSTQSAEGSFEQGLFLSDKETETVYVKFKEPVSVKSLRLSQMKPTKGVYVALYEINLIK